jgi:hypothetical protein
MTYEPRTRRPWILAIAIGLAAVALTAHAQVQPTLEQLVELRTVLAAYEDVDAAVADGFERFGDCMSGPQGPRASTSRTASGSATPASTPCAPRC